MSDLTLSIILFSLTAIIAFKIIANSQLSDTGFENAKLDAAKISEYLLDEGVPVYWTKDDVVRPGFASGLRMNSTKISEGMNFTDANYTLVKSLLGTQNDFLVVFEKNQTELQSFSDFCSFGKNNLVAKNFTPSNQTICLSVDLSTENINNLARVERIVLLDSTIRRMTVYVWN